MCRTNWSTTDNDITSIIISHCNFLIIKEDTRGKGK